MGKDDLLNAFSEFGFNVLMEKGKKLHNEMELRERIKNFVEKEFKTKFEYLPLDYELDYAGLNDYIRNAFMTDINAYLFKTEKADRDKVYNTIIDKSLFYTKAKNNELVITFIDNLLDLISTFKSKDFTEENILLGNLQATDIINNINGSIKQVEEKIDKLSVDKHEMKQKENKNYWINENTGEKIDPNKLYHKGIITAQFDNDKVRAEYTLPDGNTTYAEIDIEKNAVMNFKLAYPISEYKWDIPENLILNEQSGYILHNGKTYATTTINLKWSKKVIKVFDNGVIVDFGIFTRSFIDDSNKIIHILDYSSEVNNI